MATNLTPLLVRAHDAGLVLKEYSGYIEARPKSRLTPELRSSLQEHKAVIIGLLQWDEQNAQVLLSAAMAYLNEVYSQGGSPDFDVEALNDYENRIEESYAREDMFALRIAVRKWVEASMEAFDAAGRGAREHGTLPSV